MLETEKNLTEFCFVCGIEREKLDKSLPYGYNSHIVVINFTNLLERSQYVELCILQSLSN